MRALAAILAVPLALASCDPEIEDASEKTGEPTPTERLAALGKIAASENPEIEVRGELIVPDGTASQFSASYAPKKGTLTYTLDRGDLQERFVVSPDSATLSREGKPDQEVNRASVMLNGKDWPYASRMAAPFLDAIDGYSATRHSFHITSTAPPAQVRDGDALVWFQLELNEATAHDLLLFEFSKVTELKIGVDPETGLLKSLVSKPSDPALPAAEIRATE